MAVAYTPGDDEITALDTDTPSVPATTSKKTTSFAKAKSVSVVNILLLGKVGVGKSRIVNEMFKMEIFQSGATTEVIKGVSQREETFQMDNTRYRVKLFDTVGIRKRGAQIKRSKTMSALKQFLAEIYPEGINVVFLVYRHGNRTNLERKRFLYILHRLNEDRVPLITALVITGCANKNDSARKKIVSEFDSNPETQGIGRYVLQGMYAVGFTDIGSVPDAMTEMYKAMNYRDAIVLKEVMESGFRRPLNADAFFYRGRYYKGFRNFPWHYCPCYDRIYTCVRWGYTWEECLRVEHTDRGFVLVSFYWGYLCAPLLGHFLSDRCGGETVQWVAAIGWSLGTMLTVQFAPYSRVAVIVMQFLSGFTQGLYLPALLSVITRRTPDNSRGFLFSIIVSGGHLGSGLIGILHPLTTQQTPPSSWSTYFFLLASIVGVVWALLVRSLLQCSVKHHKTHYKLSEGVHKMGSGGGVSTGGLANGKVQGGGGGGRERLKLEVQPLALKGGGLAGLSWKSLRSPSVIVVFIVHFSSSLFLHLAMSWLPSCWDKLFSGIDHSQVWMFNVVPWVAMVVSSVAASWTCQWLISRKVSTTLIRCTLTSLSLGGSTLFLFIITIIALTGHAPFSVYLICTMIVYFCHGLSVGGYYLNPLDLAPSPSQAGLLFSAMETVGATAGIVSVHLAAITVTLLGSPLPVLILVALLNLVAFPLYLVLGSSKQFGVS